MTKELRDYFKIDDSHSKIRGFVVITDENGKILVKKENMIVKSGRTMIFNAITGDNNNNNNFNMENLEALASPNSGLTTEDMTYDNVEPGSIKCSIGKVKVGDLEIMFPITVNSNSATINSLCLYTGTTLFSRVVFNPIELSSNSTLTINYYIYF